MRGQVNGVDLRAWGRGVFRVALATALCGMLAACGISQLTAPFKGGLFGGSKEDTVQAKAPATPESLATASTATTGGSDLTTGSIGCPSFDIASSDRTITFHTPGSAATDNLTVMHRGEITGTARECSPSSSGMSVKYGFNGKVLLGPKGKAGSITLPATVTVVDGAKSTLKTEKVRVVVNVEAGATSGYFSEVREINLPLPIGVSPKNYRIYVGFDRKAPGAS
jgi:hypothetical protein